MASFESVLFIDLGTELNGEDVALLEAKQSRNVVIAQILDSALSFATFYTFKPSKMHSRKSRKVALKASHTPMTPIVGKRKKRDIPHVRRLELLRFSLFYDCIVLIDWS